MAHAGGLARALSKGIMRFLRATSPQRKAHSESAFSKRARNFVTCATLHFVRFYSCHHHFPTHLRPTPATNMTTIAALNVPTLLARSTTAKRDVRTNAFFQKKVTGVAAAVPRAGQKYANVAAAVDAGLIQGVAPFPEGIDVFGFFNDIDQAEAQRYADVEITHGRLAMLASVGFLVGESVEGSSFLFGT